jgi:hypothetical protein
MRTITLICLTAIICVCVMSNCSKHNAKVKAGIIRK